MGSIWEPLLPESKHSSESENFNDLAENRGHHLWTEVWTEARKQVNLAWAMVLANLLQYSLSVISTMLVGHLGELELAGASVATSFASVTGFTLLLGLSSALETLCGQAYGAKNYHLLSIYVEAAVVVLLIVAVPITILWWNMEIVLVFLGQDPEISKMAGVYFAWLSPALFASAVTQPLWKFLLAQSKVLPMMVSSLFAVILHIPITYFFINNLGFGFRGGALGVSVSYWISLALLLVYFRCSKSENLKDLKKTWTGVSEEAFGAVTTFLSFAVPSAAMICLEYWAFEILVLLAGILPNPQLQVSLLSICLTTGAFTYMIPLGLSGAVSTRISNELGAGRPAAAKFAANVVVGIAVVVASVIGSTELLVRNIWGRAFSDEDEVVQLVAELMPLIAAATFLDGVQGVLSGVARGCGWQEAGAWVNLASYYAIGLPAAAMLGYYFNYGALGLWLGFYCGLLTQLISLSFITIFTNWEKMADGARKRTTVTDDKLAIEGAPVSPSSP